MFIQQRSFSECPQGRTRSMTSMQGGQIIPHFSLHLWPSLHSLLQTFSQMSSAWLGSSRTWHLRPHLCPHFKPVRHRVLHFSPAGSRWQGISWECPHAIFFKVACMHCNMTCSRSERWQGIEQECPQGIFPPHGRLQPPPTGKWEGWDTFMIWSLWTGHWSSNSGPIAFCLFKTLSIFFQIAEPLRSESMFPTMYNPHFALDKATQTRFFTFRNPIFASSLLLTRESKIILFSSPW